MSNQPLNTNGLIMPSDFNQSDYEEVNFRVSEHLLYNQSPGSDFAGGWAAISYRFLACAESDELFTELIKAGATATFRERYIQERELFNFFFNGLSVFESCCYSLFALGASISSSDFPMTSNKELKDINIAKTVERFDVVFKHEKITSQLMRFIQTPDYKEWTEIRNILAHRSAPGRIVSLDVNHKEASSAKLTWKLKNIPLDEKTTSVRRKWLSTTLEVILRDTRLFTEKYFPI